MKCNILLVLINKETLTINEMYVWTEESAAFAIVLKTDIHIFQGNCSTFKDISHMLLRCRYLIPPSEDSCSKQIDPFGQ